MKKKSVLVWTLMGLLLAATLGCEVRTALKGQSAEEKTYGVTKGSFRGRWWSYYERGTSFADGQFWREAEADLKEALHQRGEDQRRARTYGMHFVDYFPHRELGVVLYHQSRFEEALHELEASLGSEKSAKAQYYLDCTRKSLIQRKNSDVAPPEIMILTPVEDLLTNGFSTVVKGVVRDDTYVKDVLINGVPVRIDLAAPEIPFQREVSLKAGENVIRISATDLSGKTFLLERRVRVDRQGPIINIDEPAEGSSRPKAGSRLKGYVQDDSGIAEVKVNGREIPGTSSPAREMRLDAPLLLSPGEVTLLVEARDRAGNQTRAEIRLSPGLSALSRARPVRPTDTFPLLSRLPARLAALFPQPRHLSEVLLASLDVPALPSLHLPKTFQLALREDGDAPKAPNPPSIELRDWTDDQTVFLDQIYLSGHARGDNGVAFLALDGQPILKKPGKSVYFGSMAMLNEGENTFKIQAKDSLGYESEKQVRIVRKMQKVHALGTRLTVAMLPLERKGTVGMAGEGIEDALLGELVRGGRFDMVERQRLEEVLREQKLGATDLADPEAAVRVGKIVSAGCVLMGSVVEKEGSLDIYARLVDTETSLILTAIDVYGEDVDLATLKQLCRGLILKLSDEVPLTEGLVVQVKGGRIIVDLGKESHVKKGMRLIVFQEGEPIRHPVTGAVLGTDSEELGHARIMAVYPQMSDVEVLEKASLERIKPMHKVITQ